jgi:hypothetical protein
VVRVDRFGNLITNIDRRTFDRLASAGEVDVRAGGHQISKLVSTYADIFAGETCAPRLCWKPPCPADRRTRKKNLAQSNFCHSSSQEVTCPYKRATGKFSAGKSSWPL